MLNTILFFLSVILVFSCLILTKKLFGRAGVIGFMGLVTVLANILACKNITILGLSTTLGTVLFSSNFLATDILTECYGTKEARRGVLFSVAATIGMCITTQIALLFRPSEIDFAQESMKNLFSLSLRITIASIAMFIVSNFCDITLYNLIRRKTGGKMMWLRNNVSTIVCNGAENFLFTLIAFGGIYSLRDIISIAGVGTVLEIIIALCDTPFLYIGKALKHGDEIEPTA